MGEHAPEDLKDLVDLRVAWEERVAAHDHLREDTTYRPHVDCSGIVARTKQDLGGSVP